MINGLCITGLTSEAEKFLIQMEEKGCSPDDCTYNTIVQGFIHNKQTSRAMDHCEINMHQWFVHMVGGENAFSLESLISGINSENLCFNKKIPCKPLFTDAKAQLKVNPMQLCITLHLLRVILYHFGYNTLKVSSM
ncbi:unnamed protein product [Prunus brigantina]